MAAGNGLAQLGITTELARSPFVDYTSDVSPLPTTVGVPVRVASPFASELEDRLAPWDPSGEILDETLATLHDETFDEVMHDLVGEAAAIAAECRRGDYGDDRRGELRAHQVLTDRFRPLAGDAERMLDEVADAAGEIDLATASEAEIDDALATTRPKVEAGAPAFEQFLGGLWKKAKKIVHGAANLAKKVGNLLPIKLILGKLKELVRPLFAKVAAYALDRVPARYRPLVGQIAKRFGIALPVSTLATPATATAPPAPMPSPSPSPATDVADASDPDASGDAAPDASDVDAAADPAAADVTAIQSELDGRLTELLLASDAQEIDEIAGEFDLHEDASVDVEAARARFVRELEALADGEDPTPAVEHILPVLMPALKMGVGMVGRDRIVDFLGGILGKLIAPVVGPAVAPALGKTIVDTGLRTFLQTEIASTAAVRRVGAEAIARTIEDTARKVSSLPAHIVTNPALLESHTREAFDRSAAANLPEMLLRPEHREGVERGVWIAMPRTGRPYYKRYSHVFDVELTPQLASAIKTFGGGTLASFVHEQLRLTMDRPLRARVHLFEILPNGRLSHVAMHETLPGLGNPQSWRSLHPLTPETAGMLLHHPRLGRPSGADPLHPRIGERVYFLELAGAPRRVVDAPSRLRLKLDLVKDEVRVSIYLSETLAQQVAAMVRARARPAAIVHELRTALASHARSLGAPRRVRTIGARGHSPIRRAVAQAAVQWAWARLADLFERSAAEFLQATDASPPGVTLRVTFEHPPGLDLLRTAARGRAVAVPPGFPPAQLPPARIDVKPGYEH